MEVRIQNTPRGYSLSIAGPHWQAEPCEISFPEEIWQDFPAKEALKNELAYILTQVTPVILRHPTIWYQTPEPRFLDTYEECFELSIPNMVEPIPSENSEEVLSLFRSVLRHFPEKSSSEGIPRLDNWNPRRVILPFTYGKDSLLSLATLSALGYEVILVNIDECVLPRGKAIRKELEGDFFAEHGYTYHQVRNEIQLLSDWQVLNRPVTRLHQVHIHFIYLFAMLPFCTYYRAPYIILSNEYENSLPCLHRDGFMAPHLYMQSRLAARKLARMAKEFSNSQIRVINPIGVLDNFSIHAILHEEFQSYGRYRVTCHMEMSDYSRWCHKCYRCAQPFIYACALGRDPFGLGFESSMLDAEKEPLYSLFRKDIHAKDDYHHFVSDEEGLALLMAYRNGAQGHLMDVFERQFLPDIRKRESRLRKRVFGLQTKPGWTRPEREAAALYKQILKKYR
ncbi:MAG TPA: hypothetical protein PLU81_02155 [Deltaproteobacteria bacterium]|nr:hypothetical protein [Deltaproteobacteria bacterium]HPR50564.1 hypothetical protein [Deltaproteobacteria bacterium]